VAIIFCTECGVRNQRGVTECRRCKHPIISFERVDLNQWEEVDPTDLALDEAMPLSIWGRAKQRPVLTGTAVLGFILLFSGIFWLVAYLNRPPRCLEYQGLDCAAIVLERAIKVPSPNSTVDSGQNPEIAELDYSQVEMLDWLRLLAMSRRPDGTLSVATLLDSSSADARGVGACFTVSECLALADVSDIDYDGLSGQVGISAAGVVRTVSLTSSSEASPVFNAWGRIPLGPLSQIAVTAVFDEIHLVTDSEEQRLQMLDVAAIARAELRTSGISLRIRVLPEAHSRSSSVRAARVIVAPSVASLRADSSEVSLELQSADREVVWRGSYSASIEHVIDAARRRAAGGQKSVVIADCLQHQVTETVVPLTDASETEVVCFDSDRFQSLADLTDRQTQWLLISSRRESELVTALVTTLESAPLLVLRL
jgi:hypothetical protein